MLDPDISTADALRHLHHPETDAPSLDRRRFLQLVGLGVGAGALAYSGSSLLDLSLPGLDPTAWAAGPIGPADNIVVVLGMFGGNDGLNTVVPYTDPNYRDQHGSLALGASEVLRLDGSTGLHPALKEFKRRWDAGQLAIVEGVGYPNADLSHFSSMAKWMSGIPNGIPASGWVGRWLDGLLGSRGDLFAAAEVGHSVPLHMIGQRHRATAVPVGRPGFGGSTDARSKKVYASVRKMGVGEPSTWTGRVGQAMVDQLDVAKTLTPIVPPADKLGDVELVAKMEVMARLINANLGFRVFSAGWGDFDSHAGQPNQHPLRMQELDAAVTRFFAVLAPAWASRVTIVTFSEFGRTSWSNDGRGTDHGTSAPHFVIGANVKGGRYGQRPSLAGLRRWDRMAHHVDFRDYFGSVIDGFLGGGASDVFGGRRIENLGLVAPVVAPARPGTPAVPAPTVPPVPPAGAATGQFVALSPARVFDTRDGTGGRRRAIGPGEVVEVDVTGQGGVPDSGVRAVAINVTSVNTTQNSNFRVFPSGLPVPDASSLNPRPGGAVPNLVVVGVGANGKVSVYNHSGSADCVVDVMGYFRAATASRLTSIVPARLLDTRDGTGVQRGRRRGGTSLDLQVTGRGGVPRSGVDAVVLNVGSVLPSARGFVTAWPAGERRPAISNLNYAAGVNVPNLVVCKLGRGGRVSLFVNAGELDLIADVVGYFASSGGRHVALPPSRVLDTRDGTGVARGAVPGRSEVALTISGRGGVAANAKSVILNVTAANATSDTFVTVYPNGVARPVASSLNTPGGGTAANLVITKVGADGKVRLYNHAGRVDLIADVMGYFA